MDEILTAYKAREISVLRHHCNLTVEQVLDLVKFECLRSSVKNIRTHVNIEGNLPDATKQSLKQLGYKIMTSKCGGFSVCW